MAGVKGKSGGVRAGAGRKPKPATVVEPTVAQVKEGEPFDPRPTLELVAMGMIEVSTQQLKALTALLPYTNTKKGEAGKKDEKNAAAKGVAAGRFGSSAPPLKLVGNK